MGFLFIIIHEFAHYIVALILKIKVTQFNIHGFGASLEIEDYDGLDISDEFIVALAGPIANLILAFISYLILKNYNIIYFKDIMEINITLGLLNLLPAYPLDGAKILRCVLARISLYKSANRFIVYISILVGFLIAILGVILIPKNLININLIIIGIFIIFISYKDKNKSMYIVLDQLIKKQVRFKNKKYMINQSISVHYKETMLSIISYIEKNKFNTFYVLNDEMKLLYEIREDEIFEIIKEYGNISLEEYHGKLKEK